MWSSGGNGVSDTDETGGRAEFQGVQGGQAGNHNMQINTYRMPVAPPASRKRLLFLAIIAISAATLIAGAIVIAAMVPRGDVVTGSNGSGNSGGPSPSAAGGGTSSSASASASSASASAPTSNPARTSNVVTGVTGHLMYRDSTFTLDNNDCTGADHYNYPNIIFGKHGLSFTPITTSPPSGAFGLALFCSATSGGSGFDPNIEYGGHAAIISDKVDFDSCYSRAVNFPIAGSIQYGSLRSGVHLCIFDGNDLALVTLLTVSPTLYRVSGTATVWEVLTGN